MGILTARFIVLVILLIATFWGWRKLSAMQLISRLRKKDEPPPKNLRKGDDGIYRDDSE